MPQNRTLSTSRVLPFSADALFAAVKNPEQLARWWGPAGFSNTFDVFEFEVNGRWLFTMHGPDGANYANRNLFLALEPARCVVIRHDGPPYFTLTVRFDPAEGGTLVTWDQVFDDAETARAVQARVGSANEENLDRLTQVLAGHAPYSPCNKDLIKRRI